MTVQMIAYIRLHAELEEHVYLRWEIPLGIRLESLEHKRVVATLTRADIPCAMSHSETVDSIGSSFQETSIFPVRGLLAFAPKYPMERSSSRMGSRRSFSSLE